jgi:hypothetical protein
VSAVSSVAANASRRWKALITLHVSALSERRQAYSRLAQRQQKLGEMSSQMELNVGALPRISLSLSLAI